MTQNILTEGQCLLPNTVLPSKFDGLNFDGLAGKRQNRQNFPPLKFPTIRYFTSSSTVDAKFVMSCVLSCFNFMVLKPVCWYVIVFQATFQPLRLAMVFMD